MNEATASKALVGFLAAQLARFAASWRVVGRTMALTALQRLGACMTNAERAAGVVAGWPKAARFIALSTITSFITAGLPSRLRRDCVS